MYNHKNGSIFRKLARTDLKRLWELKQESWPTTHQSAIVNMEDQEKWFDSIPSNALYMICSTNMENEIRLVPCDVGLLTLNDIDLVARTARIGGSIFRESRATLWSKAAWEAGTDFAFEMLGLNRLDAEVVEYNIAALKMDLSIGYKIEGRRREAVFKCGRTYDSFVLGLLRSEWMYTKRVVDMALMCNTNFRHRSRPTSEILERLHMPPSVSLEDENSVFLREGPPLY